MEIQVIRKWRGKNSTLSTIVLDGKQVGYCLEDVDRGLTQEMPLPDIQKIKIHGRTAIPEGRYQVLVTHSMRFKKLLPILLTVPGFSGIRIHSGNGHKDTEGCLLPGLKYQHISDEYQVTNSRDLFNSLFTQIQAALRAKSEVWINITSNY
ncbi:DUF5675 family protein [Dyadobacter sp. CY323]|uniref:DUF5675 family protein n=1 Tax=Dyadobacter sp. CY323 TaxID=2907302 RepID=UPI001F1B5EAA|nr:DUF5675 family protein [Dyadobacter sp. CY323]MCE6992114.1 DUF5675 family protein [Dyadobacter sp. CY323]